MDNTLALVALVGAILARKFDTPKPAKPYWLLFFCHFCLSY